MPRSEHPLNVLCEDIEFEIHRVARLHPVQIRMHFRVGNDPDNKTFAKHLCNSKADSVYGDRTLANDITGERLWQFDL